jgi:hypothetical protein
MSYKNLNSDEKLNNLINFLQFTFNIPMINESACILGLVGSKYFSWKILI